MVKLITKNHESKNSLKREIYSKSTGLIMKLIRRLKGKSSKINYNTLVKGCMKFLKM